METMICVPPKRSRFKQFVADQRFTLAQHRMESKLAKVINLMEGHKAADLPAGHKYYKMLWDKSIAAISDFRKTSEELGFPAMSQSDVAVGIPSLKELEELAFGSAGHSTAMQIAVGLPVAVGVLSIAGTLVFTFCQVIHHYLIHWVVR